MRSSTRVTFTERADQGSTWVARYDRARAAHEAAEAAGADGCTARIEPAAVPRCDPLRFRRAVARDVESLTRRLRLRDRQRLQLAMFHRWVRDDALAPGTITTYDYALSVYILEP